MIASTILRVNPPKTVIFLVFDFGGLREKQQKQADYRLGFFSTIRKNLIIGLCSLGWYDFDYSQALLDSSIMNVIIIIVFAWQAH